MACSVCAISVIWLLYEGGKWDPVPSSVFIWTDQFLFWPQSSTINPRESELCENQDATCLHISSQLPFRMSRCLSWVTNARMKGPKLKEFGGPLKLFSTVYSHPPTPFCEPWKELKLHHKPTSCLLSVRRIVLERIVNPNLRRAP